MVSTVLVLALFLPLRFSYFHGHYLRLGFSVNWFWGEFFELPYNIQYSNHVLFSLDILGPQLLLSWSIAQQQCMALSSHPLSCGAVIVPQDCLLHESHQSPSQSLIEEMLLCFLRSAVLLSHSSSLYLLYCRCCQARDTLATGPSLPEIRICSSETLSRKRVGK